MIEENAYSPGCSPRVPAFSVAMKQAEDKDSNLNYGKERIPKKVLALCIFNLSTTL
jgi:hypothetical protein